MQYAFEDGVYSPSIGFTLAFGDSVKELMPLSGISNGVGGLLGIYLTTSTQMAKE